MQATGLQDRAAALSNGGESVFVFAGCPIPAQAQSLGHLRAFAVADAYSRFRRAKGDAVLFSLGFDCFDQLVQHEAEDRGIAPSELAEKLCADMRSQFERLGYSLDWDQAFLSSQPSHHQRSQVLFLELLERNLIYRRGTQWFLRTSAYAEENDRSLDDLQGWSEDVLRAQREALGRVDGVEVDAVVLGGGKLTVFTSHADSIGDAAFIAVSPSHPHIDAFMADLETSRRLKGAQTAGWWRDDKGKKLPLVVETGLQASVPGVSTLLPIVITPVADESSGGSAVLGIPELDDRARSIAEAVKKPVAGAWKVTKATGERRPAVRYGMQDAPITRALRWGVPVPLVHCCKCGTQPVPPEHLPLPAHNAGGDSLESDCPRCSEPAQRDGDTIDPRFDRMWMWMAVCVPAEDRATATFGHPAHERWLPVRHIIDEADAGNTLLEQRAIVKMLRDAGRLPEGTCEPSADVVPCGSVGVDGGGRSSHFDNVADPDELLEEVGADVLRLALLNAAAPRTAFAWNDQPVRRCERFLARLRDYATPRLRECDTPAGRINGSTKWRRRLAKWCRVGADRVAISIEQFEMQRATHNTILLLTRIEDFESRTAGADGELEEEDRAAVVSALLVLLQLLSPFVPHITEELWTAAGHETLPAETPWPDLQ